MFAICDDGTTAFWVTNDTVSGKIEVNKNQADASRASFDLLERQLTASIDAAERLEGQVAILTAEVSALRERIVELEGLLNEVQRIAPGSVATARARRGRKPGAAKGAAKR